MKSLCLLFIAFTTATARADEVVKFKEVFEKVISQKCMMCHSNPAKKPFDMTNYAEVMTVVVAGSLENSKLYQAIFHGEMPPPKLIEKDPSFALTEDDVSLIEQWILQGAQE